MDKRLKKDEYVLSQLPMVPMDCIFNMLDAKSLAKCQRLNMKLSQYATDELIWKEHCLNDWPWFFWNGTCERTLSTYVAAPRLPRRDRTPVSPISLTHYVISPYNDEHLRVRTPTSSTFSDGNAQVSPTLDTSSLSDRHAPISPTTPQPLGLPTIGNLDKRYGPVCHLDLGVECKACQKQGQNPYFPLPKSWRNAYSLIASGRYTGMLQVLNSLQNRQMSAFTALATFDAKTKEFLLCYDANAIAR